MGVGLKGRSSPGEDMRYVTLSAVSISLGAMAVRAQESRVGSGKGLWSKPTSPPRRYEGNMNIVS